MRQGDGRKEKNVCALHLQVNKRTEGMLYMSIAIMREIYLSK